MTYLTALSTAGFLMLTVKLAVSTNTEREQLFEETGEQIFKPQNMKVTSIVPTNPNSFTVKEIY